MMCRALTTNNDGRNRSVVNAGEGKGNQERLRRVVPNVSKSLCACAQFRSQVTWAD